MLRATVELLTQHLLSYYPPGHDYARAALDAEVLPQPIGFFLQRTLDRRLALETERMTSAWFDFEHPNVRAAHETLLVALAPTARIPAGEWRTTLEQAVYLTTAHLTQPVGTLQSFVFGEETGPMPVEAIRRRMHYFAEHAYLREIAEAYFERKGVAELDARRFGNLITKIDRRMVSGYAPEDWLPLLKPLFDLLRVASPVPERGVPVSLLRMFFEDKQEAAVRRRLIYQEQISGMQALDEAALLRVLESVAEEQAEQEAKTGNRKLYEAISPVGRSQSLATAEPPEPADPPYEDTPAEPTERVISFDDGAFDDSPAEPVEQIISFDDEPMSFADDAASDEAVAPEADVPMAFGDDEPAEPMPFEEVDNAPMFDDTADLAQQALADVGGDSFGGMVGFESAEDEDFYAQFGMTAAPADDAQADDSEETFAEAADDAAFDDDEFAASDDEPIAYAPPRPTADAPMPWDHTDAAVAAPEVDTDPVDAVAADMPSGAAAVPEEEAESVAEVPATDATPSATAEAAEAVLETLDDFDENDFDAVQEEAYRSAAGLEALDDAVEDEATDTAHATFERADEHVADMEEPSATANEYVADAPMVDADPMAPDADDAALVEASETASSAADSVSLDTASPDEAEALVAAYQAAVAGELDAVDEEDDPVTAHDDAAAAGTPFSDALDAAPDEEGFAAEDTEPPAPEVLSPLADAEPAAEPPAFGEEEAEAIPLWMRFQREANLRPTEAADEPPSPLAQLETAVLGQSSTANRAWFVDHLFGGDAEAYERVLHRLDEAGSWDAATPIIAKEVFQKHRVNIYSEPAVAFTDAVETRMRERAKQW